MADDFIGHRGLGHYETDQKGRPHTIDFKLQGSAPVVGLPGSYGEFYIEPLPVRGPFTVIAALQRPDSRPTTVDSVSDAGQLSGGSHIKFPEDAGETIEISVEIEVPASIVTANANKERFVEKLTAENIKAATAKEARERGLRLITYVLNCLSFEHDVPIEIFQVDIIDSQGQKSISSRLPFGYGFLDALTMPPEMRRYAALYREALRRRMSSIPSSASISFWSSLTRNGKPMTQRRQMREIRRSVSALFHPTIARNS